MNGVAPSVDGGHLYVAPAQRHVEDDCALLTARHALYAKACECNPTRWSRHTRNWTLVSAVTLNPKQR